MLVVTLTGVTNAGESQSFTMDTSMYSSAQSTGTFGSATAQWQGSNDGTNWSNIGSTFTSANAQTLTPAQVFFKYYRLSTTGGDGTQSINVVVVASKVR